MALLPARHRSSAKQVSRRPRRKAPHGDARHVDAVHVASGQGSLSLAFSQGVVMQRMTRNLIIDRLEAIDQATQLQDDERAKWLTLRLHREVFAAIRDGRCEDAAECAELVLAADTVLAECAL